MKQKINFIQLMLALRSCSKKHLPINDSIIAYDLILFIANCYYENRPITVKELFNTQPYSYTAVRLHYKRLLANQYITQKLLENDKRIKYILPTDKLINAVNNYSKNASIVLGILPPTPII